MGQLDRSFSRCQTLMLTKNPWLTLYVTLNKPSITQSCSHAVTESQSALLIACFSALVRRSYSRGD